MFDLITYEKQLDKYIDYLESKHTETQVQRFRNTLLKLWNFIEKARVEMIELYFQIESSKQKSKLKNYK